MKIFLTGGTGFIGLPLARELVARGASVVALVRKPESPQARALAAMGARLSRGDVTDRESMREAMAGADLVLHNAAWYEIGVRRSDHALMQAINVDGTENVLGLALELEAPRVLYVSSVLYYGESGREMRDETYRRTAPYRSAYEDTKARAHDVALRYRERGLPLVIVAPAHVVGKNDHSIWGSFIRLYINGLMPPFAWSPDMLNSAVHVDDLVRGITLAAEKGRVGETYLFAGDTMRLRDVLALWMTRPGGRRVRFFVPRWLARFMFTPMAPLLRLLGLPVFASGELVKASMDLSFSSAKAKRELGWTHRPAHEMWPAIVEEELKLLAGRADRRLAARLHPLDVVG